jgi:hypothetical protein
VSGLSLNPASATTSDDVPTAMITGTRATSMRATLR